jgi:hypothetical protein
MRWPLRQALADGDEKLVDLVDSRAQQGPSDQLFARHSSGSWNPASFAQQRSVAGSQLSLG